ncbi:helix-turn-helix transcriptional regulator [Actinomadura namibiensis]|uniref:AraC-like DNA-binding protein n=1 Tax=Actinomadura namibiensis TaxID=182080 RepID=A0A7W3LMJ4_ACTNM|nr:helix-turn-helix transcriptional regulator [Actinomadura namibiensis]MBA8950842.1 AraC-like DNA-binding protein [Actinomadura namibiensis]
MEWRGAATLRPGRLRYAGAIAPAAEHAHHAVQILVANAGELVLGDADGTRLACRSAVIPANVAHSIVRGVEDGVLVLLAPESAAARRLGRAGGDVASWTRAAAAPPGGDAPPAPRHPALREAVRILPGLLRDGPVRLGAVARAVHLSEGRLAHLFTEEVGLPFRPYVRWLRLQRVIELVADGASLTDAAHEAGFADGAHLSRAARKIFGIAPSDFTRGVRWTVET